VVIRIIIHGFVTNQERDVVFVVMKLTILHLDSTVPVMLILNLKKNGMLVNFQK